MLVLLLAVAACSDAVEGGEGATTSTGPSASTGPIPPVSTGPGATPSTSVPGMVEAQTLPPPPPLDYGIYSNAILGGGRVHRGSIEYANFRAECMSGILGIVLVVHEDGGVSGMGPVDHEEYNDALEECERRALESGLIGRSMTDIPDEEDLRIWYRALVEVTHQCLVEHDYPTVSPPTVEAWIDSYPLSWTPHEAVEASGDTFYAEAAQRDCPSDIHTVVIELGRRDQESGVAP